MGGHGTRIYDGSKHGYAITEDINAFAQCPIRPGLALQRDREESRGLIEALEAEDRHSPYRLTSLGETALRARLTSMQAIARIGHSAPDAPVTLGSAVVPRQPVPRCDDPAGVHAAVPDQPALHVAKGRPGSVQAVFIVGQLLAVTAILLGAAWLGTRI